MEFEKMQGLTAAAFTPMNDDGSIKPDLIDGYSEPTALVLAPRAASTPVLAPRTPLTND